MKYIPKAYIESTIILAHGRCCAHDACASNTLCHKLRWLEYNMMYYCVCSLCILWTEQCNLANNRHADLCYPYGFLLCTRIGLVLSFYRVLSAQFLLQVLILAPVWIISQRYGREISYWATHNECVWESRVGGRWSESQCSIWWIMNGMYSM